MKTLRTLLITVGVIITLFFFFFGSSSFGGKIISQEYKNTLKIKRDLSRLESIEKQIDFGLEYLIEEFESEEENKSQQFLDSRQFLKFESKRLAVLNDVIALYEEELSDIKSSEEYEKCIRAEFFVASCAFAGMFIVAIGLMLCKDSRAIGVFSVIIMLIGYIISISFEFLDVVF